MLYIKAMKQDGTYQLLEADGYVEFLKKEIDGMQPVEVVYNYYDGDGILRDGRHWLEGDCFIMNDKGFTISAYHFKPNAHVRFLSKEEVYDGERSEEELAWFKSQAVNNSKKDNIMNDALGSEGYGLG